MRFDAAELSPKQNYKFLSGAVVPRPIAFITTLSKDGETVNAAPFSFFNVVSSDPPMISVAIQRADGELKDTARHALDRGELVIQIVSEDFVEDMNETAARLKREESELDRTKLHLDAPLEGFMVPGISEAKIKFHTKLTEHIEIKNDSGSVTADLLLLRVLHYDFSEEVFDPEAEYVLTEFLNPVSRLAGNDYARIGEKYTIRRPK
ncbi:hypothetical protein MFLO_10848 [Listeria floridensis FSL S10-1187]|uniref:Flavin reductase like domain-containing protein n=1 Tax=Listeria floridensis FSL S10-1187 TaxID=1265817 RepID=A0ABN0RDU9_9LIST|nr:flavin reductase family protein [Listeria floridensis]EUJ30315.1 hypothetical protein MFLO_10848 [Listeria floridensis FSL S10-1187]